MECCLSSLIVLFHLHDLNNCISCCLFEFWTGNIDCGLTPSVVSLDIYCSQVYNQHFPDTDLNRVHHFDILVQFDTVLNQIYLGKLFHGKIFVLYLIFHHLDSKSISGNFYIFLHMLLHCTVGKFGLSPYYLDILNILFSD